jgi:hypothetical protein
MSAFEVHGNFPPKMRATVIAFVRMDSDGGKATARWWNGRRARVLLARQYSQMLLDRSLRWFLFARRSRLNLVQDRLMAMMARVVSAFDWSALGALASAGAGLGDHW